MTLGLTLPYKSYNLGPLIDSSGTNLVFYSLPSTASLRPKEGTLAAAGLPSRVLRGEELQESSGDQTSTLAYSHL